MLASALQEPERRIKLVSLSGGTGFSKIKELITKEEADDLVAVLNGHLENVNASWPAVPRR